VGTSPTFQSMIFSLSLGNPLITYCLFTPFLGAGAHLMGSSSSFTDCDFNFNGESQTTALASLYAYATSGYYGSAKVRYCRFKSNLNFRAGGLYVGSSVAVSLDSSFFIQNKLYASSNGYSIYADVSSTLSVTNTSINANITTGNSVYCFTGASVTQT
jgi:hypothetical protein